MLGVFSSGLFDDGFVDEDLFAVRSFLWFSLLLINDNLLLLHYHVFPSPIFLLISCLLHNLSSLYIEIPLILMQYQ